MAAVVLEVYRRLLCGDPVATAEAAERFLSPIVDGLRRRSAKRRDDHLIGEAEFGFLTRTDRNDPAKAGLLGYLTVAAGDLKNLLARERRRSAGRREFAVELLPDPRNERGDDREPGAKPDGPPLRDRLAAVLPDPRDVEAAVLILSGERSTARFAAVYGLDGLPAAERARVVKRHKDRIKKALERRGAEAL